MASGSGNRNMDFRRQWDRGEYEKLAKKRLREERAKEAGKPGPPVQLELLRPRDHKVDLASKLGERVLILKDPRQPERGAYHCSVCDCVLRDSIAFLDHLNGKKHQRNQGMSMRLERSTLEQVQKRLEAHKRKRDEMPKGYELEERMKELREEEAKFKAYRKEKRKQRKRPAEEDLTLEGDDGMAAVMGFSQFGSAQKRD